MDNMTLERAVEAVRALGPEEQARLRAIMDSWQTPAPPEATPAQERAYLEHLLAKGIIAFIPERHQEGYMPDDRAEAFTPIIVSGRPVSETLLEDRGPR